METRFSVLEVDTLLDIIYSSTDDISIGGRVTLKLPKTTDNINLPPVVRVNRVPLNLLSEDRFIAIPLTLVTTNVSREGDRITTADLIHHANMILIDQDKRQIERFDPSSGEEENDEVVDSEIKDILGEHFPNFRYIRPSDICPIESLQDVEESEFYREGFGHCSAWTLYYLHMRLSHPDIDRNDLIDDLLDRSPSELRTLIVRYASSLRHMLEYR